MKKNSFIEGAFVATVSILLCKVLGLLYVIPFYDIIGNKGGALYSYAYSIYAIFLSLSTCGIPVAVAKLVSEYNALENYSLKEKIYKMSSHIIIIIGLIAFLLLFVFADNIAYMFIGNIQGGNTLEDVSIAIRIVSVALLIVPQQSVLRGYLEGHKMITTTSISNLIEQVVRVLIIVVGSYLTVKIFHMPINFAVYIAIFAATIAALSSYIYLKVKIKKHSSEFKTTSMNEPKVKKKELFKKIVFYSLPFVVIDLIRSAFGMVDSFTVVKTMVKLGYDVSVAETTLGVVATWATKLNMIVASVGLGLITSLIPNVSGSYAKKDMKDVNKKINEAYKSILFIVIPMSFGLSFLAQPVWIAFYGYDQLSINIFRFYILQAIVFCIHIIALNLAQTLNQSKISLTAIIGNLILKILLNAPMMYLLEYIGIPAYYSTIITNIIIQGSAILFIMISLKKKFKFNYKEIIKSVFKTIFCLIIMLLILSALTFVIPLTAVTRLKSILLIAIYSSVGIVVYFYLANKINLISDVFGPSWIAKVKSKIKKILKNPLKKK